MKNTTTKLVVTAMMMISSLFVKADKFDDEHEDKLTKNRAITIIEKYEGYKEKVYLCPAGFKTIGYGSRNEEAIKKSKITKEEARELLHKELNAYIKQLRLSKFPYSKLNTFQQAAILCLTFNVGIGNVNKSRLGSLITAQCNNKDRFEKTKTLYEGRIYETKLEYDKSLRSKAKVKKTKTRDRLKNSDKRSLRINV